SVTIFKGNFIAAEDFNLAGGGPIEFDFADVAADLHAVSAGIHAKRAADGAGDADEAFHSAKVVLGAVGDGAAEVSGGIHAGKISVQDNFGFRFSELENDPWEFSVADEEIRTAAQKFVWNAIVIKEAKQSRNGFVPLDEEEIRRSADAERGVLGHGDSG